MSTRASLVPDWRGRVFTSAWILYAGYYMCRKDIDLAQGKAVSSLAVTLACFGITYALGQFVGGSLADRLGGGKTALAGASISMLCTLLLVVYSGSRLALLLQLGNGFGQGFGWPSLLKMLGAWFHREERDRVLGWWSTSYILGGLLATSLAAWLVVRTGVSAKIGFQPAYLVSSAVLMCTTLFFYKETKGLPVLSGSNGEVEQKAILHPWRFLLANPQIRIISGTYFFLKMTRYTLLFWLPNYLVSNLGFGARAAGHTASYFELFGFLGPIAVGYSMQRWFRQRHMALGAGMLLTLAFICLLHPLVSGNGSFGMVVSICLMGILIHGADILMSGMAVLDETPQEIHGRAAGFVNGAGSLGQALSPLLVTIFVSHLGWAKLFDLFVFFALVAGAICAFGARLQTHYTSRSNRSALEPVDLSL
jgi:sugar phosphate permease